jgi:NTE family protein
VLAFSGGGTRAAAFSYGVLEELRWTEITVDGRRQLLLDEVDIVTGVSGGSFTALAYALYGDRLFDFYETAFLKREMQHDLIGRALNPLNWTRLSSASWGRSELAAQLYDEILFHGATFADLDRKPGPFALVTATDISTGARFSFIQPSFDVICSDLDAVPLSRAAAASSAVPFALSPVAFNNYGGSCGFREPRWARRSTIRRTAAARRVSRSKPPEPVAPPIEIR